VVPTILSAARARVPSTLPGIDLRTPSDDPARVVFTSARRLEPWRAAIRGRGKWVAKLVASPRRGGAAPGRSVIDERVYFDLARDPGEEHPQPWPEDPVARALLRRIRDDEAVSGRLRDGRKPAPETISPRVDEDQRRRLRALGYLD
jgi:hypothetical protein